MISLPFSNAMRATFGFVVVMVCGEMASAESLFEKEVRPLLEKRCFECHSHASKIKGGLALDSKSGLLQGGDHGAALVPGRPEESLLIKAINYEDNDLQMPPKTKLSAEEIAILDKWIKAGAEDPRESPVALAKKNGLDFNTALKHWAFQRINDKTPSLPTLLAANLASSKEADRYTLLRRASFDLTGLPPTKEDIASFVADSAPEAFSRVVDRLLSSNAFGERWARFWLDLVGYADQVGTANNVPAPLAWRYRDYVVRSFNADKPFADFIREQVAGDLMQASSTRQRQDQLIATGFLVLGNINIVEADKEKLRADVVDQQIEKVGKAFLGMTLNCARCHDHKFDPITLQDYYGLAGIFMSTESTYHTGRGVWSAPFFAELPITPAEQKRLEQARQTHEKEVAVIQNKKAQSKKLIAELEAKVAAAKQKPKNELSMAEANDLLRDEVALGKEKNTLRELYNRALHLDYLAPKPAAAYGTHDSAKVGDTRITIRGNAHALGNSVPRGFVNAIFSGAPPDIPGAQSGRLQLAEWLTSRNNKLTARVIVNRIWQKLFGKGIVPSVDYFGVRGDTPANPELLDALAVRFMHLGWSQKQLIREIMLSPAYRQVSSVPADESLTAQRRFRLDAEAIRDAVLAISGSLLPASGGPSLALEFSENVSGLDPKNVNPVAFSVTKFRPEQACQRTIYLPIIRSGLQKGSAEILDIFDFAQPAQMLGQRSITTVPPQALYLMNGPLAKNEGGKLGDQIWRATAENDAARLSDLYLRVFNRPITKEESNEALAFLATFETPIAASDEIPKRKHLAWASLCQALFTSNEFLFRM